MDYQRLANLLFPDITTTPADIEAMYPPRSLPEGAKVTRIAPSPTGFMHLGNLFSAIVSERLAHQSGGVFFLRIEDTDLKRAVEGGVETIIRVFNHYGLNFDEGATIEGDKGRLRPLPPAPARQDLPDLCQGAGRAGSCLPLLLHRGGAQRDAPAAAGDEDQLRLLRPVGKVPRPHIRSD